MRNRINQSGRPGQYGSPYIDIPKDVNPFSSMYADKNKVLDAILRQLYAISSEFRLDRGLLSTTFQVGTTPIPVIESSIAKSYIILNPSVDAGLSALGSVKTGTLISSGTRTISGNIQGAPLNVTDYRDLHIYLDVTAAGGAAPILNLILQTYDPLSLSWFDAQAIITNVTAPGKYYANVGSIGLATSMALRWTITGGGGQTFTFSIGYVLKDSLPGLNAAPDLPRTIYIGSSGVTAESGYPLLTGASRIFFMKENTKLWGMAQVSLDVKIFDM